jgi:hypothetical protein
MNPSRCRPAAPLGLKLFGLLLLGAVAFLSRTPTMQPPAAATQDSSPAGPLRGFGAVHPRISPDGTQVALSYQGSIWRVPVAGGTLKRLAVGPGFAFEPCWSPDGRRIAFFQSKAWGNGLLKVIDAQSGEPVPLPRRVLGTGKLQFTPEGSHVVGVLRSERQIEALRSLDLATGELKTLVRLPSPRQPWALSQDVSGTSTWATANGRPG